MCPVCYQTGGSLLHCLSTLTRDVPGGLFLLHWPWSRLHRTLSGILPCEARTFLTRTPCRARLSVLLAAIFILNYFSLFVHAEFFTPPGRHTSYFSSPRRFSARCGQIFLEDPLRGADTKTQKTCLDAPSGISLPLRPLIKYPQGINSRGVWKDDPSASGVRVAKTHRMPGQHHTISPG